MDGREAKTNKKREKASPGGKRDALEQAKLERERKRKKRRSDTNRAWGNALGRVRNAGSLQQRHQVSWFEGTFVPSFSKALLANRKPGFLEVMLISGCLKLQLGIDVPDVSLGRFKQND
ncbi:hypothetical protein NPIL_457441 [Nephila pilipes]|uniref:Uncharacterized protein n=1 Tax=Nephila pilipes TaxID=299642 RepID=A0A8X6QUI3_NEPPI|nr:hypothetical protein NPIL_457441 [Nephila pilipes]